MLGPILTTFMTDSALRLSGIFPFEGAHYGRSSAVFVHFRWDTPQHEALAHDAFAEARHTATPRQGTPAILIQAND